MRIRSYRDLVAWQKAMDLVILVYEVTAKWPREELYGLTRQVRDAVVSVPANLAEGQGRGTTNQFLHFVGIAYGSLMETETELLVGQRLGYGDPEDYPRVFAASSEVGRVTNGLKNHLETERAGTT
jgi:four helix bundle protein